MMTKAAQTKADAILLDLEDAVPEGTPGRGRLRLAQQEEADVRERGVDGARSGGGPEEPLGDRGAAPGIDARKSLLTEW